MLDRKTEKMLFSLARSHSKMAQAEYNRHIGFTDEHPAAKAEAAFMEYLDEMGLRDKFFLYMEMADSADGTGIYAARKERGLL